MKNVSDKSCTNSKQAFYVQQLLYFFEKRVVYQIMWKNIVERDRPQMAIWYKRIACSTQTATRTRSEYVIVIAFRLFQWLRERE
jgi:hypothetical protein